MRDIRQRTPESSYPAREGSWLDPDSPDELRFDFMSGLNERQALPPADGETRAARLDRAYAETLQEVRIAQCGIQILFASLLNLGLTPSFTTSTTTQRWIYVVALVCSIGAAGTLLAPAAMHRFMWGSSVKHELVTAAHRYLVSGLTFLALAISSSLVLILDFAFGPLMATAGGLGAMTWFVLLWFLGPMRTRNRARVIRSIPASFTS